MEDMKNDLHQIFVNNFELKAFLAFFAMVASWIFDNEYQAVIAIIALRFIDISTGTYAALKTPNPLNPTCIWGSWTSARMTKGLFKTGRYMILIFVSRLVDKALPIHAWSPLIDCYLAVTEGGSILENLKKLGYDVPTALLSKLTKQ